MTYILIHFPSFPPPFFIPFFRILLLYLKIKHMQPNVVESHRQDNMQCMLLKESGFSQHVLELGEVLSDEKLKETEDV